MDLNALMPFIIYFVMIYAVLNMIYGIIKPFMKKAPSKYREVPKNFMQRFMSDLLLSAKVSKQPTVKRLYLSGDPETKRIFLGYIGGTLPDKRVYAISFTRSKIMAFFHIYTKSRILLFPPELLDTDFDSREVIVRARGIKRVARTVWKPLVVMTERETMTLMKKDDRGNIMEYTVPITQENIDYMVNYFVNAELKDAAHIDMGESAVWNLEAGAVPGHIETPAQYTEPTYEQVNHPKGVVTDE